jgi:hypothetical protein
VYRLLGKPEGKRPLGRPRRTWTDNIKMYLLEIGLSVVDWIILAQDRYSWRALVKAVMNLRVRWESTDWLHNLWPLEWYSAPQSLPLLTLAISFACHSIASCLVCSMFLPSLLQLLATAKVVS